MTDLQQQAPVVFGLGDDILSEKQFTDNTCTFVDQIQALGFLVHSLAGWRQSTLCLLCLQHQTKTCARNEQEEQTSRTHQRKQTTGSKNERLARITDLFQYLNKIEKLLQALADRQLQIVVDRKGSSS